MFRRPCALALLAALSWTAGVAADVTLSLPLTSQLPPIAHNGQPYAFTISRDTFQFQIPHGSRAPPSPPTLLYTTGNLPSWLSFDATTLTFSGNVPAQATVGKRSQVSVTAALPQGTARLGGNTTATDTFGVLVLNEPAPTVRIPIVQQLTTASSLGAAYMAAPDAVHLPLGWSFSIGLSGDTFAISTGADVYWSVSLAGGAPLPDWLHFSPDTYDFYGVAPVDLDGEDTDEYDVVVTGSNRPGYGGVSQTFRLIIGSQTLSMSQGLPTINGSVGELLSQSITTNGLTMSGAAQQSALSNITVTAEVPVSASGWLSFDVTNRTLTGVPPYVPYGNASSTSEVDVAVTFNNGNGAQLTVNQTIRIPPSAFTALELPNVAVTDGAYVSIQISPYLRNVTTSPVSSKRAKSTSRRAAAHLFVRAPAASLSNVTVATDPAEASSWLKYDAASGLLSGQAPSDWSQRVHVMLTSGVSRASFYLTFDGEGADPSGNKSGSGNDGGATLSPHTRIALGASLGIAAALIALIALVCCCFRRRRDQSNEDGDRTKEKYTPQRDDDEGTLTDQAADRQRKWKKAIVIGRNGVGEVGTPSTIAVSPLPGGGAFGFDEQPGKKGKMVSPQRGAAVDLHSVVVVSPNGGRRDATHEAETPMQSRLIANLFSGGRAKRASGPPLSAGLGLSMMGGGHDEQLDDPFAGAAPLDSRGRIRHQRSRESVRSHRSSWESDLFYEDAPSSQQHHRVVEESSDGATAVNDNGSGGGDGEDVPRRRGKPTTTGLNVRHRTTHNNQSPAFNAPDVFVTTQPNAASAALSNSSRGLDQIGMSAVDSGLTESDDSQHGYAISGQEDDVRVLKARVMQVQRHSPVLHQGNNNPFAHSSARTEHSAGRADVTSGGAFDDAIEEDDEGEWLAGHTGRDVIAAARRNNRNSTMSAMTDTSQFAGVRAHYAVEAAREDAAAAGRMQPSTSFMDGISISGVEPQDSVKPVVARSQTPPPHAQSSSYGAAPQTPKTPSRPLSTTGAASGRFLPCPSVTATMGHLLRFHLYPNVPPPMAGAVGSPGKRSGRTVRYELVMLDERAHLQKYRGTWPAMLSDWLSLDATTFELEGIVPRAAELEQLRDCDIALVSTTRISGNPNSPDRAEAAAKRSSISSLSYDSNGAAPPPAMVQNDEERTVVARCKLVFQNAAPRPFFPPRKGKAF